MSEEQIIPYEYTTCPRCLNCNHRGNCKLGRYGDNGICAWYEDDHGAD